MFDRTQLQSFILLAEERHFGHAARRLFITQPALTRRIQQLEAAVGVALFDRQDRRVVLTAAGQALLPEARSLIEHMEQARRAAQDAGGLLAGQLSLGFDGAASYSLLPRLVAAASLYLPDVALRFSELRSVEQMTEIALHRLDLGLVRPLPHEEAIETVAVFDEPLALAVPVGHRLARRRAVTPREIDGEPFIAYSENGLYLRDLIAAELARQGAAPRIVQALPRTHSILALVSTGLGIAIVPAGSSAASFDNILFKPLESGVRAEWHAAWHRGTTNALVRGMRNLLTTIR